MFGNAEEIILNNLPEVTADEYKKVEVIFKQGCEIVIKCKNFSITKRNCRNHIFGRTRTERINILIRKL